MTMKFPLLFFTAILGFTSYTLAGQLTDDNQDDANGNNIIRTHKQSAKNTKAHKNTKDHNILSIPLYLPLVDGAVWASIMQQSQLRVTPRATYNNVGGILVTSYFGADSCISNCNGTSKSTFTIGQPDNPAVTLSMDSTYSTTDASNFALLNVADDFTTACDNKYQLVGTDLTTPVGEPSDCIAGTGDSSNCSSMSSCGWGSTPQAWSP